MEFNNLIRHAGPRMVYADETRLADLEAFKVSGKPETIVCPGGDMDLPELIGLGTPRFETVERDRKDTVAVLYTGGTTGNPKGVMLTQEGMDFSCQSTALYERYAHTDTSLCFLPFNHVFGQIYILNSVILSGGCLELMPAFDMDRILWLLDRNRITRFYAVPTIYTRLIDVPNISGKFQSVRYCFSGGAPMAEGILRQWKDLTGMTVADGYARNYLIPRKLAVVANKTNRTLLEQEKATIAARREKQRQESETLSKKIAGTTVTIQHRVGEEEKLFGSVTAADIAEKLAELDIHVEKKNILLSEPIKTLGNVSVPIKVGYQLTTEITVSVVPLESE